MSLYAAKFKVMHYNPKRRVRVTRGCHTYNKTPLKVTEKEKDLEVITTSNGKSSEQGM